MQSTQLMVVAWPAIYYHHHRVLFEIKGQFLDLSRLLCRHRHLIAYQVDGSPLGTCELSPVGNCHMPQPFISSHRPTVLCDAASRSGFPSHPLWTVHHNKSCHFTHGSLSPPLLSPVSPKCMVKRCPKVFTFLVFRASPTRIAG